jgi:hypothetical protein
MPSCRAVRATGVFFVDLRLRNFFEAGGFLGVADVVLVPFDLTVVTFFFGFFILNLSVKLKEVTCPIFSPGIVRLSPVLPETNPETVLTFGEPLIVFCAPHQSTRYGYHNSNQNPYSSLHNDLRRNNFMTSEATCDKGEKKLLRGLSHLEWLPNKLCEFVRKV